MEKIVIAIGGGELRYNETLPIDKYIIKRSKKSNPLVLFIPTASHDAINYATMFKEKYESLGAIVDCLFLLNEIDEEEIERKINNCDIIYVGGGDTAYMIDIWKKYHVDNYLLKAYNLGKIISGLSAGAICWFKYGHSDSAGFEEQKYNNYGRVKGLGWFDYYFCPHYDDDGRESFIQMLIDYKDSGFAVMNKTALEIVVNDDKMNIKALKMDVNRFVYYIDKSRCENRIDNIEGILLDKDEV